MLFFGAVDISLYKDESQIEKRTSTTNASGGQASGTRNSALPVRVRKSRRSAAVAAAAAVAATLGGGGKDSSSSAGPSNTGRADINSNGTEETSEEFNLSGERNNKKRKRSSTTTNTLTNITITNANNNDDTNVSNAPIQGAKKARSVRQAPVNTRKRKMPMRRKRKLRKSLRNNTDDEDEEESSDDDQSDTDYKPNQKRASIHSSVSKNTPRAQRSPLAKARVASPIVPSTSRLKRATTNNKVKLY